MWKYQKEPQQYNAAQPQRSRDSSVLIIFDNKLYNSWDPAIWKLMNTTLLDTARYEMTIYGNSKVQPR